MERKYNYEAFTPEDVNDGLLKDLLEYLLAHNRKSTRAYYDFHVTSDGYCTIVEWVSVPYEDEHYNGEFVFKDEDEYVMKEIIYPDNSCEYIWPDEEKEKLDEWLKENPGWYKNQYGVWSYKEFDENVPKPELVDNEEEN